MGYVLGGHPGLFRVAGFQEKPPLAIAEHLLRRGSLWNTFVMVGDVNAFLELAFASVPGLMRALRSAPIFSVSDSEKRIAEWLYNRIDPADFSRQVLSPGAERLVTLRLGAVEWNDLGDPDRVISTLLESGLELPSWATRWRTARKAARSTAQCVSTAVA